MSWHVFYGSCSCLNHKGIKSHFWLLPPHWWPQQGREDGVLREVSLTIIYFSVWMLSSACQISAQAFVWPIQYSSFEKLEFIIFTQFLKFTPHLQLLQDIDSIPQLVHRILGLNLYPTICTCYSLIPILISPLVATGLFSVSVSLFLVIFTSFLLF